jgi:hypothetical protein
MAMKNLFLVNCLNEIQSIREKEDEIIEAKKSLIQKLSKRLYEKGVHEIVGLQGYGAICIIFDFVADTTIREIQIDENGNIKLKVEDLVSEEEYENLEFSDFTKEIYYQIIEILIVKIQELK